MEWVRESSWLWDRLRHSPSFLTAQAALMADVDKVEEENTEYSEKG